MIRYTLKCDRHHAFDSWFASGAAFDTLRGARQLSCPECGSHTVEKAMMAPRVTSADTLPADTAPEHPLARLKAHIEKTADYVGADFAKRARAMHDGSEAHRPIYGEAPLPDVRRLVEDGVPVAPLPFIPKSRTN
ncbi:DUF1178 family protein [Maribius pontilimi]|uniref:DUF1178 family protein n=1 Tax=Palleronia pontilimi TaxID=1964209 RepID=A0A934MAC3_9RHOB|nr:DUF1178 family protein [Palleronia pontilimi]MBJ3763457.1 DUF1178 family protein [Palleronia pontilimi]